MHPEVVSDKPGKWPKCGGMELVPVKSDKSDHGARPGGHEGHDHGDHGHGHNMSSPGAAADFLRRFGIVTALLIPLAIFSMPGMKLLGYGEFDLRRYVEFGWGQLFFILP